MTWFHSAELPLPQAPFSMAQNKHLCRRAVHTELSSLSEPHRTWVYAKRRELESSNQVELSLHQMSTFHSPVSFCKAHPVFCLLHTGKSTTKPQEMAIQLQRKANSQLMQCVKPH